MNGAELYRQEFSCGGPQTTGIAGLELRKM